MAKRMTIGLDLAKQVFHLVCCDGRGKLVSRKQLKRAQVLSFFAQLEPAVVGMEACAGAHYWGRELEGLGHEVKLLPAQHVKAYVRGNKTDYNDALAIAEAARQPQLRAVGLKSVEQQEVQALHRLRERAVRARTGLCNQVRGVLGEYGIVWPKGVSRVRRELARLLDEDNRTLSARLRRWLGRSYAQLCELDGHIEFYTQELVGESRSSEACQRLQSVPGFGPIVASVFYSQVGDGRAYRRGRDVSAALGLVPRQHSSGGKERLLGISKRGDRYLRSLLVHGARAVVARAAHKDDRLSRWVNRLRRERGVNKATVALANKMARMGWAVLAHESVYQPG